MGEGSLRAHVEGERVVPVPVDAEEEEDMEGEGEGVDVAVAVAADVVAADVVVAGKMRRSSGHWIPRLDDGGRTATCIFFTLGKGLRLLGCLLHSER